VVPHSRPKGDLVNELPGRPCMIAVRDALWQESQLDRFWSSGWSSAEQAPGGDQVLFAG